MQCHVFLVLFAIHEQYRHKLHYIIIVYIVFCVKKTIKYVYEVISLFSLRLINPANLHFKLSELKYSKIYLPKMIIFIVDKTHLTPHDKCFIFANKCIRRNSLSIKTEININVYKKKFVSYSYTNLLLCVLSHVQFTI